jgi:(5-formylfuran-3-yl)methyl phosphate synthase
MIFATEPRILPRRTGLLVSVRNEIEAKIASECGVDIIDVKEPNAGSLGRASSETWHTVSAAVGSRTPISIALGELLDPSIDHLPGDLPDGVRYAKFGLSRCHSEAWKSRLEKARLTLPTATKMVAVVYADFEDCGAPDPEEVLNAASEFGLETILFDTFQKDGRTLLDHFDLSTLLDFIGKSHDKSLRVVLAGSIRQTDLPAVVSLQPDLIAVRGAVCDVGRTSSLSATRLLAFQAHLRQLQSDSVAHTKSSSD